MRDKRHQRAEILALDEERVTAAEIARRLDLSYQTVWQALRRAGRRPLAARRVDPSASADRVDVQALIRALADPLGLGLSLRELHRALRAWALRMGRRAPGLATLKLWSAGGAPRSAGPADTLVAFARDRGVTLPGVAPRRRLRVSGRAKWMTHACSAVAEGGLE